MARFRAEHYWVTSQVTSSLLSNITWKKCTYRRCDTRQSMGALRVSLLLKGSLRMICTCPVRSQVATNDTDGQYTH
jgi:hypothetical protein